MHGLVPISKPTPTKLAIYKCSIRWESLNTIHNTLAVVALAKHQKLLKNLLPTHKKSVWEFVLVHIMLACTGTD